MKKLGVLAGTPVDTKMGEDFLKKAGFKCVGRPCAETPEEQTLLQVAHREELSTRAERSCLDMLSEGAEGIFLYCNSLAGALDMQKLRRGVPAMIVTPLDVYEKLALKYKSLAVISANCQSLAAIEGVFKRSNPGCETYGGGLMPVVNAIEAAEAPGYIMESLGLSDMIRGLEKMGAEALLLGCTHFPYLKKEISDVINIPVIDPADDMLQMIIQGRNTKPGGPD